MHFFNGLFSVVCLFSPALNNSYSNLQSANEGCKALSYEDFNVSLLSIGSVFEASFLRFWLQLPRAVSGAELPADTSVWSALRVLADCPECYRNWTWANVQSEPVRYTDWLIPPSSPRGCYVFIPDPYMRQSLLSDNGLGSIQPALSCEVNHFAVCQAPAKNAVLHEAVPHQLTRPFCSRVDQAASPSALVSINTNSHTGKPCLRWDLVPANLTYFPLESNWMRHRVHTSEEVGGDGNPSYAEHFCSLWYNARTEHFDYGCYVQLDPPLFEVCDLSYCDLPIAYHSSLLSPALVASFLFSLALLLILLAIATWRGCFQHARSGYRRLFTPASFHRKRSRASLIQFMPPDTLSGLPSHEINDPTMNVMFRKSTTQLRHNVNSTGPVNTQTHTIPPTELGTAGLTSILAPAPLVSVRNGMSGYANPIYNPTLSNSPEDDYDPEAEL
ncbi:unnamed protein product [Dicrocoelium dendriticum]|nr:unnamed protein product [Dicrocoelium dendriticum]